MNKERRKRKKLNRTKKVAYNFGFASNYKKVSSNVKLIYSYPIYRK